MHPAMAAPTESPAAAAFFHGAALRDKEEAEVEEGVFSGRFLAARPAVVTQQFMRTTTAVGRCVLAGAAAATAAGAGRWARQASRAKSRRGPRSRSSQYRGVTFYRRTGRWESHIWDCGKQVYLGGFDTAQAAARAYDQAAIKFRGVDADINFSLDNYKEDIKKMSSCSKEDFVQVLRRQGAGFVRGSSRFRGVTLHKCGKWEARIGHLRGKKFVYLGLYDTEMDAAKACDKAAMDSCGEAAVCDGVLGLQSWGSQPDLELTLGCSGGSGGNHSTTVIGGNAAAPGSPRTSLTFELPEDDEEPAVWCTNRKRSIWTGPSSRAIAPLSLALGCPDGDHHPSNMLQMGVVVTDEQGQISGGGRAEEELHMLGWPTGNHCLPYAAAAASSGFPPAPRLEGAHGAQRLKWNHH